MVCLHPRSSCHLGCWQARRCAAGPSALQLRDPASRNCLTRKALCRRGRRVHEAAHVPPDPQPASPLRHRSFGLAAVPAAAREDRHRHRPAGRLPIPPVVQPLIGLRLRARVPAPGSDPVQRGVRRDLLPGARADRPRPRRTGLDSAAWRRLDDLRSLALRRSRSGNDPGCARRESGRSRAAAEDHRSGDQGTAARLRRLHASPPDRSPHQPSLPGLVGSRRRRAVERARCRPHRGAG